MVAVENQRNSVIVFLAGIGTRLGSEEASRGPGGMIPDFFGEERIASAIRRDGPNSIFVVFSYAGVRRDAPRGFEPAPYSSTDTLNQHIGTYVERLDRQITALALAHPRSDVHLVGHSLGGLIAFAYLSLLSNSDTWNLPNDGRVASVIALDAPLGGLGDFSRFRIGSIRAYLALSHQWRAFTSFNDLLRLHGISNSCYPLGACGRISKLVDQDAQRTNQDLAHDAQHHGVRILTIGNSRDYCFAPGHGLKPFVSTQWLVDEGDNSDIFGRWVVLGDPNSSPAQVEINHGAVLFDASVHEGIVTFLEGAEPSPLLPAPSSEMLAHWFDQEEEVLTHSRLHTHSV